MAIYRGPGGSGDATADQANTAQLALTYANQAASSASAASASATNASNSASAASSSASTASTAASNAQTAETNAETAETNAETAQTAAEAAQTAAEAAQTAAELAESNTVDFQQNLAVTATTLSAGSSATVSYNSGTTTMTFGLPTGATGATGSAGATGATGAQGPEGLKWLGAYAGGTSYVIDDAVSYNGTSYICKLASTGNLPTNTTYWDVLAEKGAPGAGTGDIVGPASAVGNNFAAFDGVTGKLIKDSGFTSSSFETADATILKSAAIGVSVQAYDAQLADVASLTPTDNGVIIGNGTNFVVESGSTLKTSLGLTIGTDIQAYDAQLADVAGLTPTDNGVIIGNGTNFVVESGATLKTSLGLTIGTDVQAYDSNLTSFVNTFTLPTTDGTANQVLQTNGSGTLSFASASGGITTGKSIAMAMIFGF
jgi:hypothetical protein